MRLTHFFVDRPIFSTVLSILIVLVGLISYISLPVTQYPEIAPPSISVTATYAGANAEVVADTVASIIEQQINGIENLLYMKSENTSNGSMSLTITFEPGTDLSTAQVDVQNAVSVAESQLPEQVRTQGVIVAQNSPNMMMVIHVLSPDSSRDALYITSFINQQVIDRLARIDGVGEARVFAERSYAMRVWVDPARARNFDLTAGDIVNAVKANNVQVAAGTLDAPPMEDQGAFQITIDTQGRLIDADEFGAMVVKRDDGRIVRLRDVARVELAAADYSINGYLDGKVALPIGVFQRPGSNALTTAAAVIAEMESISQYMPEGIDYEIVYNPTIFISESIDEIYVTILEATILVIIVVIVFLQNWRAAIIPIVAIPVSLIGTCALMALFGFSLNYLSLFGLVLAIGIVVDDAIVVVENIEHYLAQGMSPREAAHKSMDEVGGALVAIALVLSAVFIPTAFISGISGAFYQQFALTIATSTILSLIVSLTLSPALGALLLRPHSDEPRRGLAAVVMAPFSKFGAGFNWVFERTANGYAALTGRMIRVLVLVLAVYVVLLGVAWWRFAETPGGFIPNQDQGYLIAIVQLPPAASLSRTDAVMLQADEILRGVPGVGHTVSIVGLDLAGGFTTAPNAGVIFIPLDPFEERLPQGLTADVITGQAQGAVSSQIDEALIYIVGPPPVSGIGSFGGWKLYVEDLRGRGIEQLQAATQAVIAAANQVPGLAAVYNTFSTHYPRVYVDVDRTRAEMLDIPNSQITAALETYLGSTNVNDFNLLGKTYDVIVQAEGVDRAVPDDIKKLWVRSDSGAMVPLGTLATVMPTTGPQRLTRYNVYSAIDVQGGTAPGYSTGDAIKLVDELMATALPDGYGYEWTEMALQEKLAGGTAMITFGLAVVFVFLLLAALYESWLLPLAVILIVPMCLLASVVGVDLRGLDNNILVQIGFVVLIGLAAKNAILIVEFARQIEAEGHGRRTAAVEAARRRLRPILMTSFAFILGVVPLMIATGAGSEMRQSLGTAVFSGMLGVTIFGLLFTPSFYVATRWVGHFWEQRGKDKDAPPPREEPTLPAGT